MRGAGARALPPGVEDRPALPPRSRQAAAPGGSPRRLPLAVLRLGHRAARGCHQARRRARRGPEVPRYERSRGPGSTADVDFWTSRDVREVVKSHVNYVVADTKKWEQSAAYVLDTHPRVGAFAKNAGLGLAIPYFHNRQPHDYLPDFIVRLDPDSRLLILETKGFDPLQEVKTAAAARWVAAVNSDRRPGPWAYEVATKVSDIPGILDRVLASHTS